MGRNFVNASLIMRQSALSEPDCKLNGDNSGWPAKSRPLYKDQQVNEICTFFAHFDT